MCRGVLGALGIAHDSPEEDIQRGPAKELVFSDSEDEGDVSSDWSSDADAGLTAEHR